MTDLTWPVHDLDREAEEIARAMAKATTYMCGATSRPSATAHPCCSSASTTTLSGGDCAMPADGPMTSGEVREQIAATEARRLELQALRDEMIRATPPSKSNADLAFYWGLSKARIGQIRGTYPSSVR